MARALQPSLAGGELAPSLHARVDVPKFSVGLALCRNFFVQKHGGVANRPGFEFKIPVKDTGYENHRLRRFEYSTTQTYMLLFGHEYIWVFKDGGVVLESSLTISGVTVGSTTTVTLSGAHSWSNGDTVYITGISGTVGELLNGRFLAISGASGSSFIVDVDTTGLAYTSGGTAARVYEIATTYQDDALQALKFVQSADVVTITHPNYPQAELARSGHTSWTLSNISFAIEEPTPTTVGITKNGMGTGNLDLQYAVTAVNDDTGEESEAGETGSSTYDQWDANESVDVDWDDMGVDKYNVYRKKGGVYAFIGVADSNTFQDTNILPDLLDNPPVSRDPFAASNYPACATYFQQRMVYANLVDDPQKLEFSVAAQFHNFSKTPSGKATDAITTTLASTQANTIRFLLPLGDLLAFTSGTIWKLTSGDQGFSSTTMMISGETYEGIAAYLEPIAIGDIALYVTDSEDSVRTVGYELQRDKYKGNDLTVLATHLFEDYAITDWTYAKTPNSIIWAVRADGALLGLTFLEDHDIWAWHRHDTRAGDEFEVIEAVKEGRVHGVYAVVKRSVNGQTVRYVERLHDRIKPNDDIADAFFLDSGLTYDGASTAEVTGLHHLAGESVSILADGNVHPPVTVTADGKITLQYAASTIQVGLPIAADLQTLPLSGTPEQTLQGKKISVPSLSLRVQDSRGLWAGPNEEALYEYAQRDQEDYGDPVARATGIIEITIDCEWSTNGQTFIRQSDPLPLSVLALIPEVEVGG